MLPRLPWELSGLLLALLPSLTVASSVNVAVQASFNSPPYLLELLETAAEENSTCYFPLLDRIAEGHFADHTTDGELYAAFSQLLKQDGHITQEDGLSSFKLALSIHSAAPRIEAHYQYYATTVEKSLMVAQDAACPVWVHFDGKQYCSPTLERAQQDVNSLDNTEVLPFDRRLSLHNELPTSTLYADINSPLFAQFHQTIRETVATGRSKYRLRYRPSIGEKPLAVSGYGVELALKRTDYIVIDDREAETAQREGTDDTAKSEDVSLDTEEIDDLKPLSSSQLLGLGLKASSFVLASEDPFDTLLKVSRDFPKHSSILSKLNASEEFVAEHFANRDRFLPAGFNIVWMNGMQVEARQMNAYSLLAQLRRERRIVASFREVGLSGAEAISLISHPSIEELKGEGDIQRYDYRDALEGGNVIIWMNDIEKDKRYDGWPSHASALLQRTYPGQLPTVKQDIHNLVIPLDLANPLDTQLFTETLQTFVKRLVPVRFGIVPVVNSAAGAEHAKVVYYLQERYGLGTALQYLTEVSPFRSWAYLTPLAKEYQCLQGNKIASFKESTLKSVIKEKSLRPGRETLNVPDLLSSEEFETRIRRTKDYLKRLGADGSASILFVNGAVIPRNDNWLQAMSSRVEMDLRSIQRQVFEETVNEDAWLAGQFLEAAATHRNALIIPEDEKSIKIFDIGLIVKEQQILYDRLPRLSASEDALKQFWSHIVVVGNFDSGASKLLTEAMRFKAMQPEAEIVLIHNPPLDGVGSYTSARLFELAVKSNKIAADDILDIVEGRESDQTIINPDEPHQMATTFWSNMQSLVAALGLEPGTNGVIINGRLVGPIPSSSSFSAGDFVQLLEYERSKRLTPANTALAALSLEDRLESPLATAIVTSLIALSGKSDVPEGIYESTSTSRMNGFSTWDSAHTSITTGDIQVANIQIVASIDPATELAQRWIPILKVMSELEGVYLQLFLNPRERMQELSVKRFYRYVLDSQPSFSEDGSLREIGATFDGLPKEALLNLGLDVPPAWLVAPKESVHDLDNIKLSSLKDGADINAIYDLEHILIEGHTRDVTLGPPPRGVQLLLGTDSNPHFADTIVMANLGYFQFKANPGHWKISLLPGRSQQIFRIDSAGAQGYAAQPGDESADITLMSFTGKTLFPRLSRREGQEEEDVLEEGGPRAGSPMDYVNKAGKLASSLLSNVGISTGTGLSTVKHADINIFSVASGHLYERMLNIMMLSVMKHTSHTVKFWFIEQFLSPSFKSFLPHLAKAYGFDFEMVTYKWPHWLRAQTEKQRVIWGYKILFLDVLFPLSLDKVIFVDADQIVRTDMYELVKLDLQGAPYGFTPMCDSRTEMEGFRFWKQGYWKTFLRGLPYHISALYVVDLQKFRQIAAGDRLRQQYHQLSADPASLSNLDQDLPNHMQMVLPIHSLPQEWLWCETWCSDESLKEAKTIDLCNNPQTKEPKLKRARRQVPEWNVYDGEVEELRERILKGGERAQEGVQERELEWVENGPCGGNGGESGEIKEEL